MTCRTEPEAAGLHCDPGNLHQLCQHCGQHSTGLCEVLVARRLGGLTAALQSIEDRADNRDWAEDPNTTIAAMGGIASKALVEVGRAKELADG